MAREVTLADILSERRVLPLPELVNIFCSVLDDLRQAHSQGKLHGDIKPRKIVQGEDRVWRLTDYGVSKVSTARYIAPEKAQHREVDARTDLYSLGVVLYESAVGRPPFDAQTGAELIQAHISQPPPKPSTFKPDIPRELEQVILRALAKDPAQRFQSAREFRSALESLLPKPTAKESPPTQPASAPTTQVQPPPAQTPPQPKPVKEPPKPPPVKPAPIQTKSPPPESQPVTVAPAVAREKPGKKPVLWLIPGILIVSGVALALILTNYNKKQVPDLIGLYYTDAQQTLEKAGFVYEVGPDKDDTAAMGKVVEQNPKPGQKIKKGAKVQVRLSTGMVAVPSIVNLPRSTVARLLKETGLDSIIFINEYNDEIATGNAISSEPKPGTKIKPNTPVRVKIAAGRATCPQCGTRREIGAQFCTVCGFRFVD